MPNAPTNGLTSVATFVPPEQVDWSGPGWQLASHCPQGGTYDCAATADKVTAPAPSVAAFAPFLAYQVALCKAGTARTPASVAQARDSARGWLSANASGWIAFALETGIGAATNPKLNGLTLATGSVVGDSLRVALARLLASRSAAGAMDRPVIHVPSYAAPFLDLDIAVLRETADVIIDAGYGLTQVDPIGQAYITGRVEYSRQVATLNLENENTLTEWRRNQNETVQELMAVVRFDPCASFRALFTAA